MNRKWDPILRSAKILFLDRGIAGTSMDDVAGAAGATKRTVYNNFGSKERLVEAVFEAALDDMRLGAPGLSLDADGSALTAYARIVVLSLANTYAIGFQRLIATEFTNNEPVAAKLLNTALDILAAPLKEWLRSRNMLAESAAGAKAQMLVAALTSQARLDRLLGARPPYLMNASSADSPSLDAEDQSAVQRFVEACLNTQK
jgi:AcrR family transcriptional regulator